MKQIIEFYRRGQLVDTVVFHDNRNGVDKAVEKFLEKEQHDLLTTGFEKADVKSFDRTKTLYIYYNRKTMETASYGYNLMEELELTDADGKPLSVGDAIIPVWARHANRDKLYSVRGYIHYDDCHSYHLVIGGITHPLTYVDFNGFIKEAE